VSVFFGRITQNSLPSGGFVQPLPDGRLPVLLGAFHTEHPGIELKLIEDETDALLGALATGELDAALIGLGRYDRPPRDVKSAQPNPAQTRRPHHARLAPRNQPTRRPRPPRPGAAPPSRP